MLFALLLLGLLPAALLVEPRPEEEAEDDAPLAADDPAGEPLLADDDAEAEDPRTIELASGFGDAEIDGFRPGIDRLVLHIGSDSPEIATSAGDGGPALTIDDSVISFKGLTDVPVPDIELQVTDPATGEVTTYHLAELTPLDPVDPEAPDEVTPADPSDGTSLDPVPGDTPDPPPEPGGDRDTPLDPVPGDAPDTPPEGPPEAFAPDDYDIFDLLDRAGGGAFLDRLMSKASPEEDGEEPETPQVYEAETGAPAEVAGFVPGEDILRITLDIPHPPVAALRVSPDGADGEVWIDGSLLAILRGAPHASLADLYVEASQASG